jgi:hypothetical protein
MDDVTFQKALLTELREISADLKAIRAALEKQNETALASQAARVVQETATPLTTPTAPAETPRKRK